MFSFKFIHVTAKNYFRVLKERENEYQIMKANPRSWATVVKMKGNKLKGIYLFSYKHVDTQR